MASMKTRRLGCSRPCSHGLEIRNRGAIAVDHNNAFWTKGSPATRKRSESNVVVEREWYEVVLQQIRAARESYHRT